MSQDRFKEKQLEKLVTDAPDEEVAGEISVRRSDTQEPPCDQLAPGTIVAGHYEILSFLGQGGMSTVYKAKHLLVGTVRVIKFVNCDQSNRAKVHLRFQQEAKAALSLEHPNIVRVYEFGVEPSLEQPYLVMDFVDGKTLATELAEQKHLSQERACSILAQVSDGLAHAHSRGVVHRDIKPANIMLTKDASGAESAKIVDFGIAKVITEEGQNLTQSGEFFGTPLYMSPEQCLGRQVGTVSDLYSTGCIFYECIAGKPPFMGAGYLETLMMHVNGASIDFETGTFSPAAKALVLKALQTKQENRFQSATELKQSVQALQSGNTNDSITRVRNQWSIITRKDLKQVRALVAVMIAIAAVLLWYQFSDDTESPAAITKLLMKGPTADLHLRRAKAYAKSGMWDFALPDFSAAAKLDPTNQEVVKNCVVAYYNRGLNEEANKYALQYIKCSDFWASRFIFGLTQMALGHYETAHKQLALSIAMSDQAYWKALPQGAKAFCEVQLNHPDAAIKDATDSIANRPGEADGYTARAQGQCLAGKYELAYKDADTALKLERQQPYQGEPLLARAVAALMLKNPDGALADCATIRVISPNRWDAYLVEAEAFLKKGEAEKAKEAFDRVLASNPGVPVVNYVGARLKQLSAPLSSESVLARILFQRSKGIRPITFNTGAMSATSN